MSVTIASVETQLFHVPLPQVLTDATHGEMRHFAVATATLTTDTGEEGFGYTFTVGKMGGSAVHAMLRDDLAPMLIGADAEAIDELWQRMWWRLHYVGRGGVASFAMAAVDIALWDLRARRAGQPLWRLLGGTDPKVRVYAGGIDLLLPLDDLQRQTVQNLERGFRAIKMKVGRADIAEDARRVAAMRRLLGPDIPLMVDANMAWTVEQAIEATHAFAEHDVYWLEEPTLPHDVAGHRRIVEQGALDIATGENLRSVEEFAMMIDGGGVSYPEPDATNLGGITPWLKVAELARQHDLPVTTHGAHELHVHLLAASPHASLLEAHGFGLEPFLHQPLAISDGYATAPDTPGHGIAFNADALEPHRVNGVGQVVVG